MRGGTRLAREGEFAVASQQRLWEVGMLISPALAHVTSGTGSSGGGIAILIIIAVGIVLLLVYVGQKKWRRRRQMRDGSAR